MPVVVNSNVVSADAIDNTTLFMQVRWVAPEGPAPWNTGYTQSGLSIALPLVSGQDIKNKVITALSAWITTNAGFTPDLITVGGIMAFEQSLAAAAPALGATVEVPITVGRRLVFGTFTVAAAEAISVEVETGIGAGTYTEVLRTNVVGSLPFHFPVMGGYRYKFVAVAGAPVIGTYSYNDES